MTMQHITILWMAAFAGLVATPCIACPTSPIDPDRMTEDIKELSSEDYQGRSPGTPGEDKGSP